MSTKPGLSGATNTRSAFASAVLSGIGAPLTQQNLDFMLAWMAREGTKAAYNPLATTLNYGGGTGFNSVGVKNYPDFNTGVGATVQTLLHSGYGDIVSALQGGGGAWNASHGLSRWSGGGYTSLSGTKGGDAQLGTTGGGTTTTTAGATNAGPIPEVDSTTFAQEHYGYLAAYLNDPALNDADGQNIIARAAREGWDINRLQGALFATDWWKTHNTAIREWQALQRTDPAEANTRMAERRAQIHAILGQSGLDASPGEVEWFTQHSLDAGVDPNSATFKEWLANNFEKVGFTAPGMRGLKAIAEGEYMVPLDDRALQWWTAQIAGGFQTEQTYRAALVQLATGRFPQLAQQIQAGITPGAFFGSYKQLIAQQLEVSPDSIDMLNNPKWMQVTSFNDNGTIRPMTLSEAAQLARKQPEYRGTMGGQQQAADTAEFINKTFGKVGV